MGFQDFNVTSQKYKILIVKQICEQGLSWLAALMENLDNIIIMLYGNNM